MIQSRHRLSSTLLRGAALAFAVLLAGCATMEPGKGFDEVQREVRTRVGAETRWDRGTAEDRAARDAWRRLLDEELTPASAAQIALLNNPTLIATYEELDIAQSELVRAGLLRNPVFSGELRFEADGGGTGVALGVTQEMLGLLTMPLRTARAGADFEAAKARVTAAAVETAHEARIALQDYQAARQSLELRRLDLTAAEAANELASRLVTAGTVTETEHLAAALDLERARLAVVEAEPAVALARERVNVALGLKDDENAWFAADRLPEPPAEDDASAVERRAVQASLELKEGSWTVDAAAASARLARPLAWLEDVEVGAVAERESEGGWSVGPALAVPIPIFDVGGAAAAESEARLRQAGALHEAADVRVRARARGIESRLAFARERYERCRDELLPLHARMLDAMQREYNAMQVSAFDLLAAKRAQIEASRDAADALHDYWTARAELDLLLAGGSESRDGDS